MSQVRAVLFDLGNTLVRYWERPEFPAILEQAIVGVQAYLRKRGLLRVASEMMWERVREEDHSAPDHRVRPLEGRLTRIFGLDDLPVSGEVLDGMCRSFLIPIFARGQCYPDAHSTLDALRGRGFATAILSNTPWGSPATLWRQEIERLGLARRVDAVVFCDDVGWRKPARPIFEFALERLGVAPEESLFVGDDPRWDLAGPRALGMEAVLIDRRGTAAVGGERPIRGLDELWDILLSRG